MTCDSDLQYKMEIQIKFPPLVYEYFRSLRVDYIIISKTIKNNQNCGCVVSVLMRVTQLLGLQLLEQ